MRPAARAASGSHAEFRSVGLRSRRAQRQNPRAAQKHCSIFAARRSADLMDMPGHLVAQSPTCTGSKCCSGTPQRGSLHARKGSACQKAHSTAPSHCHAGSTSELLGRHQRCQGPCSNLPEGSSWCIERSSCHPAALDPLVSSGRHAAALPSVWS